MNALKRIAARLAVMNLALRGIEADFGPEHADTFRRDLEMTNVGVRIPNAAKTSTFENRHSNFV